MPLFIGLMSGTSADGVDAVLLELDEGSRPRIVATHSHPMPGVIRASIEAVVRGLCRQPADVWRLDAQLGEVFADAALALLDRAGRDATDIAAIGSHGQTVYHDPEGDPPVTVQIGDPNRIAERTGIVTVADFRRRDIATGGQGAPLVPGFHHAVFARAGEHRVVVNLGGIANVTLLPADDATAVVGFDTGPGNTLLDQWCQRQRGTAYDHDGNWAASGRVDREFLDRMLEDPYFCRPPPKSTGRERFHLAWLEAALGRVSPRPPDADVQRTLLELTVETVAAAIERHAPRSTAIRLCGGGAYNRALLHRFQERMRGRHVAPTTDDGIEPRWVEAAAFAWLARRRIRLETGNLPAVTGARHAAVIGALYAG